MEDQESILNEFLERIRNLEKRNEQLRLDIDKKKKDIKNFENEIKQENENEKKEEEKKQKEDDKNKKKKLTIPSEEEDKKMAFKFLYDIKNIKLNSFEIEKNVKEVIIEYISTEQYNSLYIMGDFTKWALKSMKKNKDIFSYKIVLLKGFKYYYSFQAGDQIVIDYNNIYEENPKTLQIQNYIDLSKNKEEAPQFDCENDMNILYNAQKNYFLSKISIDEEQIKFLEKFKRHMYSSKKINEEKNIEYNKLTDSIYTYYDQQLKYIEPYETQTKILNLKLFFKNKIFIHYQQDPNVKEKQYKYFFRIINITENYCFQCLKLYDSNNIKINMNYYDSIRYYYSIYFDSISTEPINKNSNLYHLLSTEESNKIMNEYNNDKNNILKAYFKSLKNINNNNQNNNTNQNTIGMRSYLRNYGSILVTPYKVEPIEINLNDYEYQYSINKITKVKNKKEGSYIEFLAIDEEAEKAKRPFRYKIYYNIKNNQMNIIHCHVLDKDLRNIKLNIKNIDKNTDPHTLKKSEEYIKNNELLLLIVESVPKKLYYKGKKVKMDAIKIEENKLYLLVSSNPDSIFNKMYVTTKNIENKCNYELLEQCNEFSYSFDNVPNGVDVQVTYDNEKNLVVEEMMMAVSPCLLTKLTTYEENSLRQKNVKQFDINNLNLNEMDKYFLISQKMTEFRKYKKEIIDKMDQKEKENKFNTLKEYKESMVVILNYIEASEMWDTLDEAVNLAAEIEELILLFQKK
jgi:hypothetical protein